MSEQQVTAASPAAKAKNTRRDIARAKTILAEKNKGAAK